MSNVYRCRMAEYIEFDIKADSEEDALEWLATHDNEDVAFFTSDYEKTYEEKVLHIEGTKDYAEIDISTKRMLPETFIASDINWDTDGDETVPLPRTEVIKTTALVTRFPHIETVEDAEEVIVDFLSDEYGYCIFSANICCGDNEENIND